MTLESKHDEPDAAHESPTCAICLSPYCGRAYLSPCYHSFCAPCLASWLDITVLCPLCKTRPSKLLWGADTTLGVLNTITIPVASSQLGSRLTNSTTLDNALDISWREALKQVAAAAESELVIYTRASQSTHADTAETRLNSAETSDPSTASSSASNASSRKREHSPERDQDVKRSRSSSSQSPSRSRSPTPIDSYPHVYDASGSYSSNQPHPDTSHPENNTLPENKGASSEASRPPTRRQVYALGMNPYPPEEYPLAARIGSADMERLAPFFERDLAVLTDADPGPVNPVVLTHVKSLFITYGGGGGRVGARSERGRVTGGQSQGQAKWDDIETGVAEWVTMSLDNERTSAHLARQFVEEMRRVAQRKWGPGRWDSHVRYDDKA